MYIQTTQKVLGFFEADITEKDKENDIFASGANFEIVNERNY